MKVIFLRDSTEREIDGVFITHKTNHTEIQEVINRIKAEYPDTWCLSYILDELPEDCTYVPIDKIVNY